MLNFKFTYIYHFFYFFFCWIWAWTFVLSNNSLCWSFYFTDQKIPIQVKILRKIRENSQKSFMGNFGENVNRNWRFSREFPWKDSPLRDFLVFISWEYIILENFSNSLKRISRYPFLGISRNQFRGISHNHIQGISHYQLGRILCYQFWRIFIATSNVIIDFWSYWSCLVFCKRIVRNPFRGISHNHSKRISRNQFLRKSRENVDQRNWLFATNSIFVKPITL